MVLIQLGESHPQEKPRASLKSCKTNWKFYIPRNKDNSIYELYEKSREIGIAPCAYASLDMALWDLISKSKYASVPLFRLT